MNDKRNTQVGWSIPSPNQGRIKAASRKRWWYGLDMEYP